MRNLFGVALLGLLCIGSCELALKVSSRYDQVVEFRRYRSFEVVADDSLARALNQLDYERVMIAIRNEMTSRGFIESAGTPDVLINVNATIERKASISSTSYYEYGSVYRPYTWGPGVSYVDYDVRHYNDGTLIIDVVDAQAKKLLWQGVGKKEMDTPSKHPEKDIPKAVALIMADFPPGVKK